MVIAKALQVTERTLRNRRSREERAEKYRRGEGAAPVPQGRPRMKLSRAKGQLRQLRVVWQQLTEGVHDLAHGPGVPCIMAISPRVSRYLAEKFVRKRKEQARRTATRQREAQRHSLLIRGAGVVSALDARHAGYEGNDKLWVHALRDRGSLLYQAGVLEHGMTAEEFSAILEATIAEKDWPLVMQRDNGSQYTARVTARTLRRHLVIPFPSLPHTPQHNPIAEQGMKEVGSYLDVKGTRGAVEVLSRARHALHALNTRRPRPSRGGLTAEQYFHTHRVAFDRKKCYADYVRLRWKYTRGLRPHTRARRMADRRAVEQMLVMNGLATVTTGALRSGSPAEGKG